MKIKCINRDCNLYSLTIKEAGKIYVLPVLSKLEKWELIADIKINLNKYGFSNVTVPEGKGAAKRFEINKNTIWKIS